ncbi:T9SS type A sorting domain-containing protein [Candidatus Marinimicrobia bacterium MT.SAG.2]|nr:T9SS type A sorting domain-containing protein [Candidatus Marinimicrobia bacterium MT.SAG.2]
MDNNGADVFGSRMPLVGGILSQATVNLIRQWITEGANPSADDSSGGFSFSDTSSFLVDKQEPPQAFSLISPADNTSLDTLQPLFIWERSVDPDPRDEVKYTLFLFSTINEDTVIYKIQGIVDTVYQFTEDLELGNYNWWVRAEDADDTTFSVRSNEIYDLSVLIGIDDEFTGIPQEYELYQNYPNPFNPSTVIKYALPKSSTVSLVIYNLMGQEIMRWDENNAVPGYYEKIWNGTNQAGISVSSGIYIYRITTAEFIQMRKMVLLK